MIEKDCHWKEGWEQWLFSNTLNDSEASVPTQQSSFTVDCFLMSFSIISEQSVNLGTLKSNLSIQPYSWLDRVKSLVSVIFLLHRMVTQARLAPISHPENLLLYSCSGHLVSCQSMQPQAIVWAFCNQWS